MLTAAGARTQLGAILAKLTTRDNIAKVLGITDEQPEEFWAVQEKTAKNRFFSYLLHDLGLPLTLERKGLELSQAALVITRAYRLLEKGLTYDVVRNWWLSQGTYLHHRSFEAKREAEHLASLCVRVMVEFPEGRPKFLAYDERYLPILVDQLADAHEATVFSIAQLHKDQLVFDADDFRGLVGQLNATGVKLLVGRKT
jgi:hypothetical protein